MCESRTIAFLDIEEKIFPLKRKAYLIGRNEPLENEKRSCDILLRCKSVDEKHSVLDLSQEKFKIMDLKSKSGTFLNGQQLPKLLFIPFNITATLKFGNLEGRIRIVESSEPVERKNCLISREAIFHCRNCSSSLSSLQANASNKEIENLSRKNLYSDGESFESFNFLDPHYGLKYSTGCQAINHCCVPEGTSKSETGSNFFEKPSMERVGDDIKIIAFLNIEDREFPLKRESYLVGRQANHESEAFSSDILLQCKSVDEKHSVLDLSQDRFHIMDLKTRLGTFLNGQQLPKLTYIPFAGEALVKFGDLQGKIRIAENQECNGDVNNQNSPEMEAPSQKHQPNLTFFRISQNNKQRLQNTSSDFDGQENMKQSFYENTSNGSDSFIIPETQCFTVLNNNFSNILAYQNGNHLDSNDSFSVPETQQQCVKFTPEKPTENCSNHESIHTSQAINPEITSQANTKREINGDPTDRIIQSIEDDIKLSQIRICTQDFNELDLFDENITDGSNSNDLLADIPHTLVTNNSVKKDDICEESSNSVSVSVKESVVNETTATNVRDYSLTPDCIELLPPNENNEQSVANKHAEIVEQTSNVKMSALVFDNYTKDCDQEDLDATQIFNRNSDNIGNVKHSDEKQEIEKNEKDILDATQPFKVPLNKSNSLVLPAIVNSVVFSNDLRQFGSCITLRGTCDADHQRQLTLLENFKNPQVMGDPRKMNTNYCDNNYGDDALPPTQIFSAKTSSVDQKRNAFNNEKSVAYESDLKEQLISTQEFVYNNPSLEMKSKSCIENSHSPIDQRTPRIINSYSGENRSPPLTTNQLSYSFSQFTNNLDGPSKAGTHVSSPSPYGDQNASIFFTNNDNISNEKSSPPPQTSTSNRSMCQRQTSPSNSISKNNSTNNVVWDKNEFMYTPQFIVEKFQKSSDLNHNINYHKNRVDQLSNDSADSSGDEDDANENILNLIANGETRRPPATFDELVRSHQEHKKLGNNQQQKTDKQELAQNENSEKSCKLVGNSLKSAKSELNVKKSATRRQTTTRKTNANSIETATTKDISMQSKSISRSKSNLDSYISNDMPTKRVTRLMSKLESGNIKDYPVIYQPEPMRITRSRLNLNKFEEAPTRQNRSNNKNQQEISSSPVTKAVQRKPSEMKITRNKGTKNSDDIIDIIDSEDEFENRKNQEIDRKRKNQDTIVPIKRTKSNAYLSIDSSSDHKDNYYSPSIQGRRKMISGQIKVCMSMIDSSMFSELERKSRGIWSVVDNPTECDVLAMNKGNRTYKFLIAMARGVPIVTSRWLEDLNKMGTASQVPFTDYLFEDFDFEKRHKFKISDSFRGGKTRSLFSGIQFMATSNIRPSPIETREIVKCSGGMFLEDLSLVDKSKELFLVSTQKDNLHWHKYRRQYANISIISSEGIMASVMRQNVQPLYSNALS